MNTHDLGLALNRPGGCADAGFVILNSYSSSPIKFFNILLKEFTQYLKNLIHKDIQIVSRKHPKMTE